MRKIFAILVALVMCAVFAPLAGADDHAYITVTLSPTATASITVDPTTWNGAGAGIGAWGNSSSTAFNLSNVGTVQCSIQINGSNTAAWTLAGSNGYNQFYLGYILGGEHTITTSPAAFGSALPAGGGGTYYETFGLHVHMPTASSTNTPQHLTITFAATAT